MFAVALLGGGIEMTREISAALRMEGPGYLGNCAKAPRRRLSAMFDPETGPAVPYFMQTIHLMRRLRDVGYEYDEGELAEFMRSIARVYQKSPAIFDIIHVI